MNGFYSFAHRGGGGDAPENTLSAVRKALTLGANWIEVDTYFADGELMVIHDRWLERTTNGSGEVTRCTVPYLRSLDAGQGEKIPFLREIMDEIAGRAGINVELKGTGAAGPVAAMIGAYVAQGKITYRGVIVSSFDHYQLMEIKQYDARIRVGALLAGVPIGYARFAEGLNAYSVHLHRECVNPAFVADAHRRGYKVFVYTVNKPEDIRRMRQLGVDGVFTDYPDRV